MFRKKMYHLKLKLGELIVVSNVEETNLTSNSILLIYNKFIF